MFYLGQDLITYDTSEVKVNEVTVFEQVRDVDVAYCRSKQLICVAVVCQETDGWYCNQLVFKQSQAPRLNSSCPVRQEKWAIVTPDQGQIQIAVCPLTFKSVIAFMRENRW